MITTFVGQHFDAEVLSAAQWDDALQMLEQGGVDLVLVNRKLDLDYSDGLEIIRRIKADTRFGKIPCILVTNYAEHQQAAIKAGAEPGFGKNQYGDPATREKVARFLE